MVPSSTGPGWAGKLQFLTLQAWLDTACGGERLGFVELYTDLKRSSDSHPYVGSALSSGLRQHSHVYYHSNSSSDQVCLMS